MRVLLDFHHHALAESYALTLHDRFGWDLWFPMGMEWFDNDIWQFEKPWHGDKVARQYLEGIWLDRPEGASAFVMPDRRHPRRWLQGITYDRARQESWDVVISSLPHNDPGYHAFAQEVGAAFGVQVGNDLQQSRWDLARFVWSSSTLPAYGPGWLARRFDFMGVPTVMTHQEFDLGIWHEAYGLPPNRRAVASFVNCFCEGPSYPEFTRFARAHADEFDFEVYGAYGSCPPDEFAAGDISWVPDIAQQMRDTRIGWHSKHWSDGFGHTIHDWFAVGRPVIGYARYYKDKIAGILWDEGRTSFDLEGKSEAELLAVMRRLRDDDDWYRRICEQVRWRFDSVVDFDAEADLVKALIESVL